MTAPVRVLLFATARTAVNSSRIERTVPERGLPVRQFLDELVRDYPALRPVTEVARFVRNGEYLLGTRGRIGPGDELAIHPPYSGG